MTDHADTYEFMQMRVRRAIGKAKFWQAKLLLALRNDDAADCHPDAARWQRKAYMSRARRITREFGEVSA